MLSAYDLLEINGVMYSNVYVVTGLSDYPADLKTVKGTAYLYYPVSMNDSGVLKAPSYQLKEVTVKEKYQLLTSPVKLNTPEIKESCILDPKATEKQTGVQPLKDANSLYSNVNTLVHEKIPVTKVDVICMDMDANEVVAGAVFSVYKKSDLENGVPKSGARYVDQWKTEAGMKRVIQELEAGETYVVIESDVPAGYVKARPLEFTVLSAGETTRVIVPMQKTKVLVSKWDATNDKALAGVTMQILDTRGNIVTEWTTEATEYVVTGKLSVGIRYILHEAAPVKGYTAAADSVIVLLPDGTLSKEETTAEIKDEEKNLIVVKNVLSSSGDSKNEGSSSQITDNTSGGGASGTDGKDTGYVKTGDDNTFANLYLPVLLAGVVLVLLVLTIRWDRRER